VAEVVEQGEMEATLLLVVQQGTEAMDRFQLLVVLLCLTQVVVVAGEIVVRLLLALVVLPLLVAVEMVAEEVHLQVQTA
jgi:hypothetical protein